ncbi:N-acetylmuramoyl-L-alanine amidase [Flavobacterium suaedae]|uniref:N-acetylmuramoyl-L-alanine amidase n=1 Tax=Flavobacterium suaedae TaxID=1767027 RepID=A0ABQ1JXK0_9FLAO|nr:N-acetylmuramoyl-L-alanine amidase [Flavobacterium suaedae]GGB81215.1 N-acetylmuramoyl-L-alanine amidase [Flavobacterium suaedae]
MTKRSLNCKLILFVFIICCGSVFAQGNSKFKVVLDAGHGGKDPGASSHGYVEKQIALSVVLKVGKLLEQQKDVDLVYTRKTDVFIELDERANIANNANANIFVSIHCNAVDNQSAYGTETFVMGITKNASNLEVAKKENAVVTMEENYKIKYKGYDPNKPESLIGLQIQQEEYLDQSIELASKIQKGFTQDLKRKNRGVKQAGFLVLRGVYMPRILVELGFLSHKPEGKYLNSDEGQDKLAKAIADAILEYKKEYYIPIIQSTVNTAPAKDNKPEPDAKPIIEEVDEDGVIYKVQIAASRNDLELVASNFKGLDNVSKLKSGTLIKYYYGSTNSYETVQNLQKEAREKGFKEAFAVAFKKGEKISVTEALSLQKKQ